MFIEIVKIMANDPDSGIVSSRQRVNVNSIIRFCDNLSAPAYGESTLYLANGERVYTVHSADEIEEKIKKCLASLK